MQRNHTYLFLALSCIYALPTLAFAQNRTLRFQEFLDRAIALSREEAPQEMWVVNFWASHNGPSMEVNEQLIPIYRQYQNKPIRFYSVSVDKVGGNFARAARQQNLPWQYVTVPDQDDYDFLRSAFQHNSLPALFIVDEQALTRRMRDVAELRDFLARNTSNLPGDTNSPAPAATTSPQPNPASPAPSPSDGDWIVHTVKSGDTLWALSRRYGVTVDDIKRANGMSSNALSVGQRLKVKRR